MLKVGKIYEVKYRCFGYCMDGYEVRQNKIYITNEEAQKSLYLSPPQKILVLKMGTDNKNSLYLFYQFLVLQTGETGIIWNYGNSINYIGVFEEIAL